MYLNSAETDWLGSRNIFYNVKTNRISDNISELIEINDLKFHSEGLRNYLDYGYSVFGQTPVENICILEPNAKIFLDENKKIKIIKKQDPFEKINITSEKVEDVLDHFHYRVNEWCNNEKKDIIVPTSGGFDSRFIVSMIDSKDKIHAYTYGLSENQYESFEVVYAKKLCELLSVKWEQIELENFLAYTDSWYEVYGVATHCHGMYQMEFYDKIRKKEESNSYVISGIYGDLWAGNWKFADIDNPKDLINLGITHGAVANSQYCKLKKDTNLRDNFFENNRYKLKEDNWKIIFAARKKIVLLSYLLHIPEVYGLTSWSPFLDFEIVSKILNLRWDEKERRKWQVEYFRKQNLLIGELNLKCDRTNSLDVMAWKRNIPPMLDTKLLGQIMDEKYVEEINAHIGLPGNHNLKYFNAYMTLYPIQKVLYLKEYGTGE